MELLLITDYSRKTSTVAAAADYFLQLVYCNFFWLFRYVLSIWNEVEYIQVEQTSSASTLFHIVIGLIQSIT